MIDWITISQDSGSGNAIITVTADTYSGLIERTENLKVSTLSDSITRYVTLIQDASSPFTVTPSTIFDGGYGGSYRLDVNTPFGWTVTTIPNWMSLSQSSGSSGMAITLVVNSNIGGSRRNDSLVFTDAMGRTANVSVTQEVGSIHGNPENLDFTIEFLESGSFLLNFHFVGNAADNFIKFNDGEWQSVHSDNVTQYNVNEGDIVCFRTTEKFQFTSDTKCIAYGNPHSIAIYELVADFGGSGLTSVRDVYIPNDCYIDEFFANCTGLVEPPSAFPSTQIHTGTTYVGMFKNCTSLQTAPVLPLTTDLHAFQYDRMFEGCTSLVNPPELPATVLPRGVYRSMFKGCTSLVTAPDLPSVDFGQYAYNGMFEGCTSLVNAPALPCTDWYSSWEGPANGLAGGSHVYEDMFKDCTSLVTPPALPAADIPHYAYKGMFSGCTSLATLPQMPSLITLEVQSCRDMFNGCTSITDASNLSIELSAVYGCSGMFKGCTALTKSPILLSDDFNLAKGVCEEMFYNCSSLNTIACLTTKTGDDTFRFKNWVYGVPANGIFIKKSGRNWTEGVNGVPPGWTIVDAP